MRVPARPAVLPFCVITGFLGAGKTTLLNQLLREPELAGTLVIINEFGEIGLDHLLVETAAEMPVLLSSGCLCCSMRGDLVATLEDLLRRRDNGRIPPFLRVLVETTGLADPVPVLQTVLHHPYLMLRYCLQGVVTVVDAVNGAASLARHAEAVKQAAVADMLVLTKSDLCADQDDGLEVLLERLRRLNPAAPILDAARGDAHATALLRCGPYDPTGKIADVASWLGAEAYAADEHAHHAHPAAHDANRHDAHIRAFCLRAATPITPRTFDLFLGELRARYGAHLLRVKGIIALADDPGRPLVIHGVQHMFHPPVRLGAWPDDDHTTRIVCIGHDLPPDSVGRLWGAFTGAPDVPDAAALIGNPLAPRPRGLLV